MQFRRTQVWKLFPQHPDYLTDREPAGDATGGSRDGGSQNLNSALSYSGVESEPVLADVYFLPCGKTDLINTVIADVGTVQ